ncbi:protein translocase subunit SecD [Thiomicrorhabdus indica]|uniref:protein translocase subunit SecD n=1 Tax=Thiomicrorhabdus indica TaxID=2267253 RepID=UPI00102DEBFB|nr:protein translocase subunit SecD [Thiomicrorhabdus indica]
MFQNPQKVISNQYPAWKYLLLVVITVVGLLYAMPNIFGDDPAVQVSPVKSVQFDETTVSQVNRVLEDAGLAVKSSVFENGKFLIRFKNTDDQLKAKSLLKESMGRTAVVALNLAPATPEWLSAMGGQPMYLGLDLRGGVHFLMDVDMDAAIAKGYERSIDEVKSTLRDVKIRYRKVEVENNQLEATFRSIDDLTAAQTALQEAYGERYSLTENTESAAPKIVMVMTEKAQAETKKYALQQNITTLRNRINELGVAEPVIQQQGDRRIVVQLPGVQDTARAKEILGATATLEFRLVDEKGDPERAEKLGFSPSGSQLYHFRDGRPILLKRQIIVSGESVINAQSSIDPQQGSPMVSVNLDGAGGRKMLATTKENINKRMAVLFIENRVESVEVDGKKIKKRIKTHDVINAAVIRGQFADRFQITGLDSSQEAQDLALLLRAGALAAPMEIVEERTVGPSLGQDNINQGFMSVVVGFVLVLIFMVWRYKIFGLVANVALTLNLVIIFAVLSMLQATLTLPGIAGIVLTVGMAVDANVLIFERIREELRNGSIQNAIYSGYEKAFVTIADANITTLLAAIVLFSFGTGPIKGFAITLSIGIITSMFTAILGTRAIINLMYGNKRVEKLSI